MKSHDARSVVVTTAFALVNVWGLQWEPELVGQETYRKPPQEVVDIIDALPVPSVNFSPDRQWMLLIDRPAMPSIEDLSRRMLRLAGMRVDPAANSRFATRFYSGISLRPIDGNEAVDIPIPEGAEISDIDWSHHSNRFAFTTVTDDGQQLWIASVEDPANPIQVTDRLSTVTGGLDWMPDGQSILCQLIPEDRGSEPEASRTPVGPNIQESSGNTSPTRTYQDLLSNAHDEALFEYYATNQLARISLDGDIQTISKPVIFTGVSPSPDGNHILVTRIQKPFSYLMTYRSTAIGKMSMTLAPPVTAPPLVMMTATISKPTTRVVKPCMIT